jgi:hypothetical protein
MVSHCANPECRAPFVYFREGKLIAVTDRFQHEHVEFFWLCGRCAQHAAPRTATGGMLPSPDRNDLNFLLRLKSRMAAVSQN